MRFWASTETITFNAIAPRVGEIVEVSPSHASRFRPEVLDSSRFPNSGASR